MTSIPPAHVEYVSTMAGSITPQVIYDIGACMGSWSWLARRLFPDAVIIAFEASERWQPLLLDASSNRAPLDACHIAVLSDADHKRVKWYANQETLGTGDSYYREQGTDFYPPDRFVWRDTETLDDVVRRRGFPPPDLVKIDVQGAELDVIRGGLETLRHARDLIIELQHDEYNEGSVRVDASLPEIERALGVTCAARLFCNNGPDGDYHFTKRRVATP